jgi:hypothetical protein
MNKKSIIGIVLVLLSVSLFVFFYRPISISNQELKKTQESLNANILDQENKLTLLEEQKVGLNLVTDTAMNILKNAIPSAMSQDVVIRDLISISDENKVSLNSISFGKGGANDKGVSVLRVNAGFEGGFNDLIRFLEGIETNNRKFTVNSISVQLASLTVGGIRKANFSVAMETYFLN